MKLLTSATLAVTLAVISSPTLADIPDFSKTSAAKSSYQFSQNAAAKQNFVKQASTRHDFSKTTAANQQYQFEHNDAAPVVNTVTTIEHDFSKTAAHKKQS